MPESKQAGRSRLFILFHFFLLLFLSTVSRGKEAEFLILWGCLALFSWEMSEAAADLNERSSSLKICHAVINAGFCWWAADGPLMSLYFWTTQRQCGSSPSLPPWPQQLPSPSLPAHPGSGFHHVKARVRYNVQGLSLKKSQQLPFSSGWCSPLPAYWL